MTTRRAIAAVLIGAAGVSVAFGVLAGVIPGGAGCPPLFAGHPAGVCPNYVVTSGTRMAAFLIAAVVMMVTAWALTSEARPPIQE